jgi:hypothetical protein
MRRLTERQEAVLRRYIAAALEGRPPPTMRQVGEATGRTHTSVHQHVAALRKWGYMEGLRVTHTARGEPFVLAAEVLAQASAEDLRAALEACA